MRLIESFWVALSTYSVIPSPQFEWNQRNMKYSICFFPAVGIVCGGLLALWCLLSTVLGIGSILFAVFAVCLPLLITGGIHMDGFMDTVDALFPPDQRTKTGNFEGSPSGSICGDLLRCLSSGQRGPDA